MVEVVTLGETMALFATPSVGLLRHTASMNVGVAGAESNVAIGLRRLGVTSSWVGRVGDDELGQLVQTQLRGQGVDLSGLVVDADAPTGLMVKERRTADITRVYYYRRGSAGSRLCVDDLDDDLIAGARILHVTGITPALSETARAAVDHAVELARRAGTTVSLDFNYRSALWTPERAGPALRALTARADIVFAGHDEAALVVGTAEPEDALRALAGLGPRQAVVKLGAGGASAVVDGTLHHAPALPVQAVDPVGAGDAFVAGYLTRVLEDASPPQGPRLGCLAGAFAAPGPGGLEG